MFTFGFILFCLIADVAFYTLRVKTTPLAVHLQDAAHGCTECNGDEWKVTASRSITEGAYSYATDPGCKPDDEILKEAYTFVRMIIFAPTTLAIGTHFESYDLTVTKGIRSGLMGGTWLGRKLDGNNNATAECALLAVPIPIGGIVSGGDKLQGRSTNPKISTLGPPALPEREQSDRGSTYDCPIDGGFGPCHGNYGSDARAVYKPTQSEPIGGYSVFHTVIKNWYHDDGIFRVNPRQFTLSLIFKPAAGWKPSLTDMQNSIKALSFDLFRKKPEVTASIN